MSRIHEALRKAAQERSAQGSQRTTPELVDLSSERLTSAVLPEIKLPMEAPPSLIASGSPVLPQVDQFLQRCPHPDWRIEPKLSVFSEETHSPAGAERFRTLRSRLFQIA